MKVIYWEISWKECNFGVVGYFSASEGFRQQLCQFLPNRSSKHIKLTVIPSPIDLELGITKNDRIYQEILWKVRNFGFVDYLPDYLVELPLLSLSCRRLFLVFLSFSTLSSHSCVIAFALATKSITSTGNWPSAAMPSCLPVCIVVDHKLIRSRLFCKNI
jgi:hypothetical protein